MMEEADRLDRDAPPSEWGELCREVRQVVAGHRFATRACPPELVGRLISGVERTS
jgi:hypothetical protein